MIELLSDAKFLVFTSATLICIVPTIVYYWHKIRQAQIEADLKRDMLERGMSAEDICAVLEAGSGKRPLKNSDSFDRERIRSAE